jgi:stromal membrane-associated protein
MIYRKIENFIRTKYESKRWAMDGPMPDPATLEGDDEVVGGIEIYGP